MLQKCQILSRIIHFIHKKCFMMESKQNNGDRENIIYFLYERAFNVDMEKLYASSAYNESNCVLYRPRHTYVQNAEFYVNYVIMLSVDHAPCKLSTRTVGSRSVE